MKKEADLMDKQKEILKDYDIIINTYENNDIGDVRSFLGQINNIIAMKDDSVIQLLNTEYIAGYRHIHQAIAQSIKAFNEKQNFANDKGLEICVRLSAQKQIKEALKLLGITSYGNITVVYINTSKQQINEVESLLSTKNNDLIEKYDTSLIKAAYNIPSDVEDMVDYINEKIALLSII